MAKIGTDKADSHQHQPTVHLCVNDEHDEDTLHTPPSLVHQPCDDAKTKA